MKRSLQLSGSGESGRSVEAEDTDVLVMLLHHSTTSSHTLYFTTQSGTYDVIETRTDLEIFRQGFEGLARGV